METQEKDKSETRESLHTFSPSNHSNLRNFVSSKAQQLQANYLKQNPKAKAKLAALRKSINKPVGSDPETWQIVFEDFPENLIGKSDEPNRWELAAHTALALFSLHMQSAKSARHVSRVGLGQAIRKLIDAGSRDDQDSPVMRRFHALGTASTFAEIAYHARGLIQLMRAKDIPLDYGMLAQDFADLLVTSRQNSVRLRWARQLYKVNRPEEKQEKE
ncbi:type I-E CRISPR-associated protein Cse2/CasB [Propionimicrobium lymphophilum]|uniref:CRISPR type I-e/-associated protein casb/cse2 n=1 Tax=Propionimicrobium lymphophilum ACS-093-V-SCH5 TaxID=883161 RepID=S2WJD8_9ACTN|nr:MULTISPECIES: type I-E CRISPR-associated protein Cse2/CasB [Propionimicrobium]EPD32727.1 CRISPR type I-e/-associated protein casb/cse2 [Propionimicrobium lymphophilum ACS-093-V-SCH5]ETJ98129.1 CRISPR type TIGR02548-associated protein CasB/Cse2 [Propionimicrobium sp. BV2F7]MDK7709273.1 type I-E CRISPR-associated protein Cse2/CasB [Propionimicrobium lymphophilum]MDK7733261.1 type I-E CRISPR-associated protein Cse2/CasB [Propionimicrobium lymphophilum]